MYKIDTPSFHAGFACACAQIFGTVRQYAVWAATRERQRQYCPRVLLSALSKADRTTSECCLQSNGGFYCVLNCADLETCSTELQTRRLSDWKEGALARPRGNGGGRAKFGTATFSGTRIQRCTFERRGRRKRRVSLSMEGSGFLLHALSLYYYTYLYDIKCFNP